MHYTVLINNISNINHFNIGKIEIQLYRTRSFRLFFLRLFIRTSSYHFFIMFFFYCFFSFCLQENSTSAELLNVYLGFNESYVDLLIDIVNLLTDEQIEELTDNVFNTCISDDPFELAVLYFANYSAFSNVRPTDGKTPFMIACEHEKMDNARFINMLDTNGTEEMDYNNKTALDYALENNSYPVIAYHLAYPYSMLDLDDSYTQQSASFFHSYLGNITGLAFLDEKKYDVNFVDVKGRTPLIMAVLGSHLRIIQYLVENGANVNYEHRVELFARELKRDRMSVLDYALLMNNTEIIDFLKEEGALTSDALEYTYAQGEL